MKIIAESSLIHISFIFITTVNSKTQRNRIKAPIFINKLLYKHHMHLSDTESEWIMMTFIALLIIPVLI